MQAVRLRRPDLGDQPGQDARPRQQDLPLPQPRHRLVEQRPRPLRPRPGPRRDERPDLLLRAVVGEVPVAVRLADLRGVLPLRGLPLGVQLHRRRVSDLELARQVVHHHRRNVQRIRQEQADEAHRPELKTEAQPVVVTAPLADQHPVRVVEEEEPLQLRALRRAGKPAVRGNLVIAEELYRHRTQRKPAKPGCPDQKP